MTERSIVYMPLDEIRRAVRNPKLHAEKTIRDSIDQLGFIEPITIDERTGLLVSGHGRLDDLLIRQEAREAAPDGIVVDDHGRWSAPVVRGWASKDNHEAERALVVLNRATEAGGWDLDSLSVMLSDLASSTAGLVGTGYEPSNLDELLAFLDERRTTVAEHERTLPDENPAPPRVPENPVTRRGDVWMLGDHRLMCGDCRDDADVARLLDGATVNLAVTSPPYAQQREYDETSGFVPIPPDEYVEWFAPVARLVAEHLADDGSWLVNIKPPGVGLDTDLYVFDLVAAHVREWGWHFATEFCWERLGVPKGPFLRLKNQFEPVYQFARGRWKFCPTNVRYRSENAIVPLDEHPGHSRDLSKAQGGDGHPLIYPEQQTKRHRGDTNRRARHGVVGAVPDDVTTSAKARRNGRATSIGENQGTNWEPGEAIGDGWAYPGNRLPSFSGSHEATGHPAAYPVGLPAFLARLFTEEGDVVYDPFTGSGSSLLAAEETGRRGFGMELSPAYCDVTAARFQRQTGVIPVLIRDGEKIDGATVLDTAEA